MSLEAIAEEAGYSRRTLYRYFSSREQLVVATIVEATDEILQEAAIRLSTYDSLADRVAELAVFTREIQDRRDDRDFLLSPEWAMLVTTRSGPLLNKFVTFLMPYVEHARQRGEVREDLDVPRAAEWITRLLAALWPQVSLVVDLDDHDALREFVRAHAVDGLR